MSHPLSKVNIMQHNLRTPIEVPRQFFGRVKSAAMDDLRGQLGSGLSRSGVGEMAEIVRRMDARVSSLKCDLAGRFGRADGGAGTGYEPKKNVTPAF